MTKIQWNVIVREGRIIQQPDYQDITDEDYKHTNRVWGGFGMTNLGKYHDLYVPRNTLLPTDVFESFCNKCIEIYEPHSEPFLSPPRLPWQTFLKKTEVELEFLMDIGQLLMVEKALRGGMCETIHWYAKVNNMHMKDYDANKDSSYLIYWNMNSLYGWTNSQKLPMDGFKCIKQQFIRRIHRKLW